MLFQIEILQQTLSVYDGSLNHATKYSVLIFHVSALGTESFSIYVKILFTIYLCVIGEQITVIIFCSSESTLI
jgi:hypothetical protein